MGERKAVWEGNRHWPVKRATSFVIFHIILVPIGPGVFLGSKVGFGEWLGGGNVGERVGERERYEGLGKVEW